MVFDLGYFIGFLGFIAGFVHDCFLFSLSKGEL